MTQDIESTLRSWPRPEVTDQEMKFLLGGTDASRYGKVKRLLAKGKLLQIRRGLYCLTDRIGYVVKPHPFELAQYIYWPSYISFESALQFHGLIPEAVYTVVSATSKRRKTFLTPLGMFNYEHLPLENLFTGVQLVKQDEYQFFMATPWKAICDYIYINKKEWKNLEPLAKSLRIDIGNLPALTIAERESLAAYYHHSRIDQFLKNVPTV